MSSTEKRLAEFLKNKGIKYSTAEKACGISNGLLGKAITKDMHLGSDKIENILKVYPELSAEWLMRGTGNMLATDGIQPEQVFKTLNMPPNSDKIIEVWKQFMDCTQGMQELYLQANLGESVQKTCDHDDTQSDDTNNE